MIRHVVPKSKVEPAEGHMKSAQRESEEISPPPSNGKQRNGHAVRNILSSDHRGHLDVLNFIPKDCHSIVVAQCVQKRLRKGDTVWRQGDKADCVGFLMSGKAMSTYHSPNGKVGVTGFWGAGDVLGCADLVVPCERQMTVCCIEDATVSMLPIERFYDLTAKYPEFAQTVIRGLSIRLRWVSHLALTLETAAVFARVCSVLLALSERFSAPHRDGLLIDLNMTHEDLAGIVGVSRQFMNVTLHDLEEKGVIRFVQRKIVINDQDKLQQLAYSH